MNKYYRKHLQTAKLILFLFNIVYTITVTSPDIKNSNSFLKNIKYNNEYTDIIKNEIKSLKLECESELECNEIINGFRNIEKVCFYYHRILYYIFGNNNTKKPLTNSVLPYIIETYKNIILNKLNNLKSSDFEVLTNNFLENHFKLLEFAYTYSDFSNKAINNFRKSYFEKHKNKFDLKKQEKILIKISLIFKIIDIINYRMFKEAHKKINENSATLTSYKKLHKIIIDNSKIDIDKFINKVLILSIPLKVEKDFDYEVQYKDIAEKNSDFFHLIITINDTKNCKLYYIDSELMYIHPYAMYKIINVAFKENSSNVIEMNVECLEDNIKLLNNYKNSYRLIRGFKDIN